MTLLSYAWDSVALLNKLRFSTNSCQDRVTSSGVYLQVCKGILQLHQVDAVGIQLQVGCLSLQASIHIIPAWAQPRLQ